MIVTDTKVTIEPDEHTAPIHIPLTILAAHSAHLNDVGGTRVLTLGVFCQSIQMHDLATEAFWAPTSFVSAMLDVVDELTATGFSVADPPAAGDGIQLQNSALVVYKCTQCGDTGALHDPDGTIVGICSCPAGVRGTERLLAAVQNVDAAISPGHDRVEVVGIPEGDDADELLEEYDIRVVTEGPTFGMPITVRVDDFTLQHLSTDEARRRAQALLAAVHRVETATTEQRLIAGADPNCRHCRGTGMEGAGEGRDYCRCTAGPDCAECGDPDGHHHRTCSHGADQ
ncbi:hypothetical protein OG579_16885 [Williamsia herbipolensis]|uniref:Uncharacterized protein n=1 Tax=Williamsia herbipolensis TaxID=1603258 RepID=A0AAU4K054_9NOCA|nr:hypothetical protein [Williamsia herbipolensis]